MPQQVKLRFTGEGANLSNAMRSVAESMVQAGDALEASFKRSGKAAEASHRRSEMFGRSLETMKKPLEELGRTAQEQIEGKLVKSIGLSAESAARMVSGFAAVASTVAGFAARSVAAYAPVERGMDNIANTTGATDAQLRRLMQTFSVLSAQTGQSIVQLQGQFQRFFDRVNMQTDEAREAFTKVTMAARAAGSSFEDMGDAAAVALGTLQVPARDLNEVLNSWVRSVPPETLTTFTNMALHLGSVLTRTKNASVAVSKALASQFAVATKALGDAGIAAKTMSDLYRQAHDVTSRLGGEMMEVVAAGLPTNEEGEAIYQRLSKDYGLMEEDLAGSERRSGIMVWFNLTNEMIVFLKAHHAAWMKARAEAQRLGDDPNEIYDRNVRLSRGAQADFDALSAAFEELYIETGRKLSESGFIGFLTEEVKKFTVDLAKILDDLKAAWAYLHKTPEQLRLEHNEAAKQRLSIDDLTTPFQPLWQWWMHPQHPRSSYRYPGIGRSYQEGTEYAQLGPAMLHAGEVVAPAQSGPFPGAGRAYNEWEFIPGKDAATGEGNLPEPGRMRRPGETAQRGYVTQDEGGGSVSVPMQEQFEEQQRRMDEARQHLGVEETQPRVDPQQIAERTSSSPPPALSLPVENAPQLGGYPANYTGPRLGSSPNEKWDAPWRPGYPDIGAGKSSQFGSWVPFGGKKDPGDRPGSATLGTARWDPQQGKLVETPVPSFASPRGEQFPEEAQGIALPSASTLGQWYRVVPPSTQEQPGPQMYTVQQTDLGPGLRTGKAIDIGPTLSRQAGYPSEAAFPTGSRWSWQPTEVPADVRDVADPYQQGVIHAVHTGAIKRTLAQREHEQQVRQREREQRTTATERTGSTGMGMSARVASEHQLSEEGRQQIAARPSRLGSPNVTPPQGTTTAERQPASLESTNRQLKESTARVDNHAQAKRGHKETYRKRQDTSHQHRRQRQSSVTNHGHA